MPTIAEFLNQNVARIQQNVVTANIGATKLGFEVELEGGNGRWPNVEGWEIKHDGSLRNGAEYIFDGPRGGDVAKSRIAAFVRAMAEYGPEPTLRCSTHLHMDVREVSWDVLHKIVLAYMVFEDVFFDHCDPLRRNSNFCIPFMNNDFLSTTFGRRILASPDDHMKWDSLRRWSKYSALNLQVVSTFGSVEFRGSHAMTTVEELEGLALRMQGLKQIASAASANNEGNLEFVTRLSETNPADIFPVGAIRAGYEANAGGIAQGLSSAVNAITQGEMMGDREAQERARLQEEREAAERVRQEQQRRQARDAVRRILNREQRFNMQQLRAYNIQVPLYNNTLSGVISTVTALRALNVPATLSNISDASRDVVQWVRNNITIIREEFGYELADEAIA
ncbi:amidoligase enzyme [Pseudomonas phage tf]|uniref:Amidoligase n=1 Tax=Pseudomonas phage tf TaxID=1114179 RepID=I2FLP2_9CAUD|nr:amidoligase enzyme [Pseudomonas phage tf]CCE60776.2 amidoligase [Pseudomonas phage tf]